MVPGAFLPGIICGLQWDGIAHLGHYKDKHQKPPSFHFTWYYWPYPTDVANSSGLYSNSCNSWHQDYIDRVMVAPNHNYPSLVASVLIGALLGALIDKFLLKIAEKNHHKKSQMALLFMT